jgi:hypothetical protein
MNTFGYIACSLLVAGVIVLLGILLDRRRPKSVPFERQRERLEQRLGERLSRKYDRGTGELDDIKAAIARHETFTSAHPGVGRVLTVLDRIHGLGFAVYAGFFFVALFSKDLFHTDSPLLFSLTMLVLLPLVAIGFAVESIPAVDGRGRAMLAGAGVAATFTLILLVGTAVRIGGVA